MAAVALACGIAASQASADMFDMTGVEPQDMCAECHGLDGIGNHIKFPRLAGQKRDYIIKQVEDFRAGRRRNADGQMEKIATEIDKKDIPRVADWFSKQDPPWPKLTIEAEVDLARARQIATSGIGPWPGCLDCHSASSPYLYDRPYEAPRIAGQRDYYLVKELHDFREGRRANDPDAIMRDIARRLTDAEIVSLAVFLSQNPALHTVEP